VKQPTCADILSRYRTDGISLGEAARIMEKQANYIARTFGPDTLRRLDAGFDEIRGRYDRGEITEAEAMAELDALADRL
jgi:hypothetical protein